MTGGPIGRTTDWDALAEAIRGFEDLEQAVTAYLELMQAGESVRLMEADLCRRVSEQMGPAGLKAVAQASHRRATVLQRQAAVAFLAPILEKYPTLTFNHLEILSRLGDALEIGRLAERAADEEWSPAELRRAIAASRRAPEDGSTVVKKADSVSERGKSVIDQAVEADVVEEVRDRFDSLAAYAQEAARRKAEEVKSSRGQPGEGAAFSKSRQPDVKPTNPT